MTIKLPKLTELDAPLFHVLDPPPDSVQDPHSQRTRELALALERAKSHMPYKRAEYLTALFHGKTPTQAAEAVGYSRPPALRQQLKTPGSPEAAFMALLREVYLINAGPTIEQRKYLLWDIALQHKDRTPAASIKAVDVINRMENLYGEVAMPQQTTINNNIYASIDWEKVAHAKKVVDEHLRNPAIEHDPKDL